MATKRIVKWYFGEDDKMEVKKYSKKISTLFKLKGYNPEWDDFVDYFDIGDFFFIPCIKEGYDETNEDDYDQFEEDAINALNSAYDSSVRINLDDIEEYAKEEEEPVGDMLSDLVDRKDLGTPDFIEFLDTCEPQIKRKFVSWLFN